MGARAFVWIGGALFVASLSLCAWLYITVFGRPMPFAGWAPVAVDAALITTFAVHHSVFARERVKRSLARSVPAALLRSTMSGSQACC